MQNDRFLSTNPNKLVFHKKLKIFQKYCDIHFDNMLFIDDKTYQSMFNELFNAIFLGSFDNSCKDDNYLLKIIFHHL
jgi:hypothetical protein